MFKFLFSSKKKKNRNRIPPYCRYCLYAGEELRDGNVLCSKKGVVSTMNVCRHYRYDPLRREPMPKPVLPSFDSSDFCIDDFEEEEKS